MAWKWPFPVWFDLVTLQIVYDVTYDYSKARYELTNLVVINRWEIIFIDFENAKIVLRKHFFNVFFFFSKLFFQNCSIEMSYFVDLV